MRLLSQQWNSAPPVMAVQGGSAKVGAKPGVGAGRKRGKSSRSCSKQSVFSQASTAFCEPSAASGDQSDTSDAESERSLGRVASAGGACRDLAAWMSPPHPQRSTPSASARLLAFCWSDVALQSGAGDGGGEDDKGKELEGPPPTIERSVTLPPDWIVLAAAAAACARSLPEMDVDCEAHDDVPERSLVMFDWDDTLLPSWYIKAVVEPCSDFSENDRKIQPDSPFYGLLKQHAELVADTLRAACAHARVAIVTLSRRPWVHDSAARFLPGLDLPGLLKELDIPIYYAFEHIPASTSRLCQTHYGISEMASEGVDILAIAKCRAMAKCVHRLCGKGDVLWNTLSIGDSVAEKTAIKDLSWQYCGAIKAPREFYCKSVKLIEDPTLQHLREQLEVLIGFLPNMLAHREDFDVSMEDATEATLEALCSPQNGRRVAAWGG